MYRNDSLLSKYQWGRLNDYTALHWGKYYKTQGLYYTGKNSFTIEKTDNNQVINLYSESGELIKKHIIKQKDRKFISFLYYYNYEGIIEKIEMYKYSKFFDRSKLKDEHIL